MKTKILRDIVISVSILVAAFLLSVLFHYVFDINEHISTLFAFAVFLISILTDGYLYGIVSALLGTLAINYAFTFPYFAFDFVTPVNLISAIVMITIAVLTGTLTTKLKKHEATKAESEKERMRANLLRAVSHDIRTPLTTIYSSASTLEDEWNELTDKQKVKMLACIKEDSDWLVRMVENLLSVTKIDSGDVKIVKTSTDLFELIDAVLLKHQKYYPERNVDILIPDEIIFIPVDAILIEQVLVNLLDNAERHAVGLTKLELRVLCDKRKVTIEIEDNGCGIPEDKFNRIFDGYYNSEDIVVDSKKKNVGIGLSVCSTIIKAHGGTISAENKKSGGAIFRIILDREEDELE